MKVIEAPAHIEFEPVVTAMLTPGVTVGVTVIVIVDDVAVAEVSHPPVTVITHDIISPFTKVVVEYVLLFAPEISVPFNFH